MISTYSDLHLDYMQIYDLFWNNHFNMAEIMATMVSFGTGVIHGPTVNIPCQYLIGGLNTYGESIWVAQNKMIWFGSLLYTR